VIDYYHAKTPRPGTQHRWVWVIIDLAWMFLGTGLILACAGIIADTSKIMGTLSPIGTLLVLISLAFLMRNGRRARAMVAVGYLEQAVRLNLPLPAMLEAAERSERGLTRKRLARLREKLEAGTSVALSLRLALPGISPRIVGLAAAGEEVARLPAALARAVQRHPAENERTTMRAIMLRWYPIVALIGVAIAFGLIGTFVLPKIEQILHDFRVSPPRITTEMFEWWDVLQIPITLIGILFLVWMCGRTLSEIVPVPRPPFGPFRAITDRLAWMIPVWRGVIQNRGLADVCHVMADAIGAGQPADRALFDAREVCTNIVLENRVSRWSQGVSAGETLAKAARKARMPTVIVGMLESAQHSAGTKNVFDFLARYYDTRFSAVAELIESAAIPAMVFMVALVVGTIALGLFLPLVHLIDHLSLSAGGGFR
jgi:type IV pilus assembly protein PilC